jgi:hypothetical protein
MNASQMVGERTQHCDTTNDQWGVTTLYYKRLTTACDTGSSLYVCYECTQESCRSFPCL